MSLESMAERVAEVFTKCFGQSPRRMVAAPGRVNLIGEHTDYNDGYVLPIAIERFTVMGGTPAPGRDVTLHNLTTGDTARFSITPEVAPGEPSWSNYVRGVIAGMQRTGHKIRAFNAVIDSDVPFGGGLASSAALEVATATLIETMGGFCLEPRDKALLCQKAEHEYAGVPCGIMDQFTSVLARQDCAMLIDCRSQTVQPVEIKDPEVTVLVINTGLRHMNAESGYAARRAQCLEAARILRVKALRDATLPMLQSAESLLGPVLCRRARHVVLENERTLRVAAAIEASDWETAGKQMYESHESLRDLYEVSTKELDLVVASARAIGVGGGVFGCRMTGAGFGGCAIALTRTREVPNVARKLAEIYEKETSNDLQVFPSHPAGGVRAISILKSRRSGRQAPGR